MVGRAERVEKERVGVEKKRLSRSCCRFLAERPSPRFVPAQLTFGLVRCVDARVWNGSVLAVLWGHVVVTVGISKRSNHDRRFDAALGISNG